MRQSAAGNLLCHFLHKQEEEEVGYTLPHPASLAPSDWNYVQKALVLNLINDRASHIHAGWKNVQREGTSAKKLSH